MIPSNNKVTKKRRNRKILSCFTCRSLRQKCDRKQPICTRCVTKGLTDCQYMSSEMDKRDYAQHLKKHGLSDARLEDKAVLSDVGSSYVSSHHVDTSQEGQFPIEKEKSLSTAFTPKKVSFILPEPITQKKFVNTSNQYSAQRYSLTKLNNSDDVKKCNTFNSENLHVDADITDYLIAQPILLNKPPKQSVTSLANQLFQTHSSSNKNRVVRKSKSDFENQVFENQNTVKNSLFLNYQARNSNLAEAKFDITAHSTVSILQLFSRIFAQNIWNIWRFMTMDFIKSIDTSLYKRIEFTRIKQKPNFEDKWVGEKNENLLESILEAIPKDFEILEKIVMCYFDTDLHKMFKIISEKSIKRRLKQIFVTDENNIIVRVQLTSFENQYYLGIILTMLTMMVDPELYHHEVFKKVNTLIVKIELDNVRYAYLKCQFFLIVFTKNQLQYKSSFLKDSGSISDLVNWAFQIDFPNLIKKREAIFSATHPDVIMMKNIWYTILYIETLLFLEVGKPLRFRINSFDETYIDVRIEGVFGLMNRFVVLMRKLITCIENPLNDVDFDFLISKIDNFIAEELSELPHYLGFQGEDSINSEDYLVLNPLMSFKISLLCHKYSLIPKEEKKAYRSKLFGTLFAARRLQICQQNMALSKARQYELQNDATGTYALTSLIDDSLKTDEILPDNKHRPQWLYKYITPMYGLAAEDELSDKAVSITEAIALEMLSENLANGKLTNQTSMGLEELEQLAINFINKGFFDNDDIEIKGYTYYDILILDKIWIEKADNFSKLIPARVSFPVYFNFTLVLKLLLTIDVCMENIDKIDSFDDFVTKFESITIRRQAESGMSTGLNSAVVTDYTTDIESNGRRSRASSSTSIRPSFERQPVNLMNLNSGVNTPASVGFKGTDEDPLNSELVLGSLPETPGFNIPSGSEGIYFQTNPSTPRYTDIDLEEMGLDNFEFNTFMKLFN